MANNSLIAAFGRMWQQIKSLVDDSIEIVQTQTETNESNLANHKNNTVIHITETERSKWNTIGNTISNTEIDYLFSDDKSVFYIGNNSYYFIEGMTWGTWISSSFNTAECYAQYNYIYNSQGLMIMDADGAPVMHNDLIIVNGYYTGADIP